MIDALYNYRQGDIHFAEFSDEFNALCIPFEESLTEAQFTIQNTTITANVSTDIRFIFFLKNS